MKTGKRLSKLRTILLIVLVLLVALTLHWLIFQGREIVPGVIARPLGPCDVDWYGNRGGIVALGCPHMDYIKLWPLPIEQPWFEHPLVNPGESLTLGQLILHGLNDG